MTPVYQVGQQVRVLQPFRNLLHHDRAVVELPYFGVHDYLELGGYLLELYGDLC